MGVHNAMDTSQIASVYELAMLYPEFWDLVVHSPLLWLIARDDSQLGIPTFCNIDTKNAWKSHEISLQPLGDRMRMCKIHVESGTYIRKHTMTYTLTNKHARLHTHRHTHTQTYPGTYVHKGTCHTQIIT